MSTKNTPAKKNSRDPWINSKLIAFIEDAIEHGVLRTEDGTGMNINALRAHILTNESFAKLFTKQYPLTRTALAERLGARTESADQCDPKSLLWTKQRAEQFDTYYRLTPDNAKIAKRFDHLPPYVVKNRIRWLRGKGVTKATPKHVSGLFRVIPDTLAVSEIEPEASSLAAPIHIDNTCRGIVPLVSLNFGLPYARDMRVNTPRCAMETCAREGYAVVIAGGLLHLDIQKASTYAQRRARLSVGDIDPDMFPAAYRTRVMEITTSESNVPIFMTLMEKFEDRLAGVAKVFRDADKKDAAARFSIPIFFMLTSAERALIDMLAYYEIRYQWLLEQRRIAAEVSRLGALLRVDPDNEVLAKEYDEQLEVLDHSRLLSHVSDDNRVRASDRLQHYFVYRVLQAIPNARYVGSTEAYFTHRGASICFMEYGGDQSATNLLDDAMRNTLNPLTIRGELPDRIVLINRWSPCGDRTLLNDTRADVRRFIEVIVPPPTCDIAFVQRHMLRHGLIEHKTPLERFVLGKFTEPGMYALIGESGLPSVARYEISALHTLGSMQGITDEPAAESGMPTKCVTFLVVSDVHVGNTKEEHARGPGVTGPLHDMTGALLTLLRKNGGAQRVHSFLIPDDITHGLNHEYEVEPDGARLSIPELEALRMRMLHDADSLRRTAQLRSQLTETWNFLIDQILKCGIYRIEDQLRKFLYLTILPNTDVFADIVRTFVRSGAMLDGPSTVLKTDADMRDLPVIMLGNGNHFANSGIRGKSGLSEGFIIAETLKQALLQQMPELASGLGLHSPLVGSPLLGQNTFGCARLHTPVGGLYGVAVRGSPARFGSANGYGLVAASANELERGNYNNIFHGVPCVLAFYGDKHKTGQRDVPGYRLIQCGTFATEDAYSHHGFSRVHNAGVLVSVPASGLATGPTITTFIPTPWIRQQIEDGATPNWDEIIPDPL